MTFQMRRGHEKQLGSVVLSTPSLLRKLSTSLVSDWKGLCRYAIALYKYVLKTAILSFSQYVNWIAILNTLESTFLDETTNAFQNASLIPKEFCLEFVILKCVSLYKEPIPPSLRNVTRWSHTSSVLYPPYLVGVENNCFINWIFNIFIVCIICRGISVIIFLFAYTIYSFTLHQSSVKEKRQSYNLGKNIVGTLVHNYLFVCLFVCCLLFLCLFVC